MNTTHLHIPSNKVRDIERYFHTELADLYPDGEIGMFVLMLFEAFLGWNQTQFLLHRDDTVNQSDLLKFHWAVEDLKKYRPVQHIAGYTDFCGCRIAVSPDVLVPRPETEEIVSAIPSLLPSAPTNILDLCTGSGCIAIALAQMFPQARVCAADISAKALEMARQNAEQNRASIHFVQCDLLHSTPLLPYPTFDLIVSNPPYVMERERATMEHNVLDYEPDSALFVPDNDPLLFYRVIGCYAIKHLNTDGLLVLEINEQLGDATSDLLRNMGFDTTIRQDFRNRDRCVTAHKTQSC